MTAITRAAFWMADRALCAERVNLLTLAGMALILTGNGLNLVRASGPATEPKPAR